MTHAFFKALLFLGAGSVMHALAGELDMQKMGGLKKYLPKTFFTMFVATLAISGVPLFSGFFSKDEILYNAFISAHGHPILWALGLLAAILTAFYMFRLLFLTFFGKSRMDPEVEKHVHESPNVMTVPLVILAFLAFIGGYAGLPHALGGGAWFERFLEPVFYGAHSSPAGAAHHSFLVEYLLMAASIIAAAVGIIMAYMSYISNPDRPRALAEKFNAIYKALWNKYYVDEFYNIIIVKPLVRGSEFLWSIFDVRIIDGIANGSAWLIGLWSHKFRIVQSGLFRNYALIFVLGVTVLVGFVFFR